MKKNKYSKEQITSFTEKADQEIVLHIWECDLMDELLPDQFIERYQELHKIKYGIYLKLH